MNSLASATPALPTQFAPAERLAGEEISEQIQQLDQGGRMKRLIDAIPGLVAVLNGERQILLANAAWEELAQKLGRKVIAGLRPGEFFSCQWAFTTEGGCGTTEACRSCGATQAILAAQGGQHASKECRIATITRINYDFRATTSLFAWQGQKFVLMILSDISDEKRRQVLEKIFFHDMLNTASSVSGLAMLIAEDPASSYELKDDLLLSAETLINEIKNQRMLLAAEQNQLVPQMVPVQARLALEAVRQLYRSHPATRGKKIEIDYAGANFELKTDPVILQRTLGNMLKNALEASAAGGVVWLGADVTPHRGTFWCQNQGEMPREVALQVFQRSFTTKGVGRGIGTYSMKLLGERYLGGTVSFTTSAEEGTRFQLSLPRP